MCIHACMQNVCVCDPKFVNYTTAYCATEMKNVFPTGILIHGKEFEKHCLGL